MRAVVRRAGTHLVVSLLLLGPALAAAAEEAGQEGGGHEAGNPWVSFLYKCINLSILGAILYKALKKPVGQGLRDRADNVRRELAEARNAKEVAEAKFREYKVRVARLEDEIRQLRDEFKAEGERQRDRILKEGEDASAAVARNAEAAGANEVKRAVDELRVEMAELAMRLAEGLLTTAYTADDQKKAVEQTIQNVERLH